MLRISESTEFLIASYSRPVADRQQMGYMSLVGVKNGGKDCVLPRRDEL